MGKKVVKDYQENRECLVLNLVKKYPLYSLDKLAGELPGISRHSIQNILERNDLSTVKKRLIFVNEKKLGFALQPLLKRAEGIKLPSFGFLRVWLALVLDKSGTVFVRQGSKKNFLINIAIVFGLVLIVWQGTVFLQAKTPELGLDQPSLEIVNEGEKLFLSGKVIPVDSRVNINGVEAAMNGNGSFTAIVSIPMGKSVLKFEAINKFKKAQVLRIVNRLATKEELEAKAIEEEKKKRESIDRAANIDKTVNDLLAAKNANGKNGSPLRILNNRLKEENGLFSITGEVANTGKETIGGVMVTANLYNQSGSLLETKYGFATSPEQTIKPGEQVGFETQATGKQFDHYNLELSWEEGKASVAGVMIEKEVTASGEFKKKMQ